MACCRPAAQNRKFRYPPQHFGRTCPPALTTLYSSRSTPCTSGSRKITNSSLTVLPFCPLGSRCRRSETDGSRSCLCYAGPQWRHTIYRQRTVNPVFRFGFRISRNGTSFNLLQKVLQRGVKKQGGCLSSNILPRKQNAPKLHAEEQQKGFCHGSFRWQKPFLLCCRFAVCRVCFLLNHGGRATGRCVCAFVRENAFHRLGR